MRKQKEPRKCTYCKSKKKLDHLLTSDSEIVSICNICLKTKAMPQSEATRMFQAYNKTRKNRRR